MKRFTLPVFDSCEKELELSTDEIRLLIDFDDVNHPVVEELTKLIVSTLNAVPKTAWDAAVARGENTS